MKPRKPVRWLVVLLAGTLLLGMAQAQAAPLFRWTERQRAAEQGNQPAGTQAVPAGNAGTIHFHNPPGALARLRLEYRDGRYQAWADNQLHGPTQVMLRFKHQHNVRTLPALPATATLPARGSAPVADILASDPQQAGDFELMLDSLPGDPAAKPVDYDYRLPFDPNQVRVDQGPGGSFSHYDPQNRHAVDFALETGTPILAVREGMVMQVESDYDQAGLNREKYGGRANFIRIVHDDGSMAVYAHLQPEGVQVRAGQHVRKGQRIGLSGNTGFSTAPHLHFVLQVNAGMRLQSIPFRMFGPLGELKFPK